MTANIKEENLQSLDECYQQSIQLHGEAALNWSSMFILPIWLKTWWNTFGDDYELFIRSVHQEGQVLGIAPLMLNKNGDDAYLIGSPDVCDYLDFITIKDSELEQRFFGQLMLYLREAGVQRLILSAQRPDSAIFRGLIAADVNNPVLKDYNLQIDMVREDQSFELKLASDWDSYLAGLKKKQRHEVRRKLRRLENEGGSYFFRVIEQLREIEEFYPAFIELFKQNPEKADFLNEQMAKYFKSLISNTAETGLARFGLLELEGKTIAAVLYFDYDNSIYLYNSGYNSDYHNLSAGLLSKVLAIKHSVEQGKKAFDFLKGEEVYKSRLGGTAIPIYKITLKIN